MESNDTGLPLGKINAFPTGFGASDTSLSTAEMLEPQISMNMNDVAANSDSCTPPPNSDSSGIFDKSMFDNLDLDLVAPCTSNPEPTVLSQEPTGFNNSVHGTGLTEHTTQDQLSQQSSSSLLPEHERMRLFYRRNRNRYKTFFGAEDRFQDNKTMAGFMTRRACFIGFKYTKGDPSRLPFSGHFKTEVHEALNNDSDLITKFERLKIAEEHFFDKSSRERCSRRNPPQRAPGRLVLFKPEHFSMPDIADGP
ncbi:hypothetical protein FDECE_7430 [Fusarium decemcellulare]|nr:hypothetical protein FDECE_7430 [Fusarium decemcellulare]